MAEAIKGVMMNQGTHELKGQKLNKYLFGFVLVTDKEIKGGKEQEQVLLHASNSNFLGDLVELCERYKLNFTLGELDQAILTISNMSPEEIKDVSIKKI